MAKRPSNQPIRKAIEKVTGKKLSRNVHVDHIKPLKDGGKHVLTNLQLITKRAHEAKTRLENKARSRKNG